MKAANCFLHGSATSGGSEWLTFKYQRGLFRKRKLIARKSHEPKHSRDFRALEPPGRRLRRKIGLHVFLDHRRWATQRGVAVGFQSSSCAPLYGATST